MEVVWCHKTGILKTNEHTRLDLDLLVLRSTNKAKPLIPWAPCAMSALCAAALSAERGCNR
jgi:hypothetical protein